MFRKVGAVILLVSDMERSIDFYQNILELELKNRSKDWTEFIKNGTVLALHPTKFKNLRKDGIYVGFRVGNLEKVCNKLKAKNVRFVQDIGKDEFGKHAVIQDPDGYLISIIEMEPSKEGELEQAPGYYGFTPV